MNLQVIKNWIAAWLKKIVLYGLYIGLVVFFLLALVFQIPAVQQTLVDHYLSNFSAVSGFQVKASSFYLTWYDRLEVEGLQITDPQQNTLISAQKLKVNFRFSSLLNKGSVNIDGVALDSAQVNLITIPESDTSTDLNINVFISRINQMFASGNKGGGSTLLNIGEVVLANSAFSYVNTQADSIQNGFDYNHFHLTIPEAELQDFKVIGDTTQFNVRGLFAKDRKTGFEVKQMETFFRISQTTMEFLNLKLKAGESIIGDTIIFSFLRQVDLNDFNHKVKINARLKGTVIHPKDLALFAPGTEILPLPLLVNGNLTGRVNRFFWKDMSVKMGNTLLTGSLDMDGLPAINETFINLKLKKSTLSFEDIAFLFPKNIAQNLTPLKTLKLDGTFTGFINDFVANGDFIGRHGRIISDINLKVDRNQTPQTSYEGNLQLLNFNIGALLKDSVDLQRVTLKGKIKGKGMSRELADFYLDGKVDSIGIRGYNYKNISTDARFARQFYNGKLTIDDPNLKFNALGFIDFRKGNEKIKIKASLDTALLEALKLNDKHLFIRSLIDIDTRGLEIDSLFGNAEFRDTYVEYGTESLQLDSMHLVSQLHDQERALTFRSSIADLSVVGNYTYSTLFYDFQNIFHEFYLTLRNDKAALQDYYLKKPKRTQEYEARFKMKLHDIGPLVNLTKLDLYIAKGTPVEGRFANGITSIFDAYTTIDTITYKGSKFLQTEIEFNGSKIRDSTNILASLTLNSNQQILTKGFSTKNLLVEGIWDTDHIDLGVDFDQVEMNNQVRLKSQIDLLKDNTRIKLLPSRISILNKEWQIDPRNYTLISGQEIEVHDLDFNHASESILLDGMVSTDPDKELTLTIKDLSLDILNAISTEKFNGLMNAELNMKSLYGDPYLQNEIKVSKFSINDFVIGDVLGNTAWNPDKNRFDINFSIDRLDTRTLELTGYYDPDQKNNPLNVNATFRQLQFKILEPLVRDIFTQLDGTLTGSYAITGTFAQPLISGEGTIRDGQIMINYLKTFYKFNGILGMAPRQIIFKEIEVRDVFNHTGNLDGYIAHKNFNKFSINLDASFKNFQVMNTTAKDNNLFYGQAYGTGNLNILGPTSNLKFSATARTDKNTRLFIPVNGLSSVDEKDFISFVNFTDTVAVKTVQPKKKKEAGGITMDLNLDITPDAYGEIIFDIKAGDIIRGRGKGNLKLQLDTKGEFNMFGSLEFTEGAYNFTLYDIINKEFSIKPGSRITWFGDPYEGLLNITALYKQLASLAPILTDPTLANSAQIKRKYPTEVQLKLDGPMLSPTINFDIGAIDLPENVLVEGRPPVNLKFEFNAFKARLDEQELKRQVFSLIILKKFSPPDAFSTSGTISNSVSELLSNQLSYWLNQVDQNLEVDFDLGAFDQETFNTFQFRLSYSFLNGRLRVTGDGTYTNQSKQSDLSSIVGDWTVDYLLTPDGKFKVKMYSRSNYNQVANSLGTQTAMTTGVSLLYTQSFSQLKELWQKRRKETEKQEQEADGTP